MLSRRVSRQGVDPQVLRLSNKSKGFSEYRQAALNEEIESGKVVEGVSFEQRPKVTATNQATSSDPVYKRGNWSEQVDNGVMIGQGRRKQYASGENSKLSIGAIAHSDSYRKKELYKQATVTGASGVGSVGGTSSTGEIDRLLPEVYSPLYTMANLNLPRDKVTVNSWCRNFFQLHPIVRNAITLHATYPISKINLKCHDRKVLQFHEDMAEEMGLIESLGDVALEYWKLGECFPFSELNEGKGKWAKIIIQNPDYVHVKKTVLSGDPIISLRPDAVLQRLVMSNNPADIQLRKNIPEKVIHHVRSGQVIPLDNFNISHLKMVSSPYDIHGTSIIVSVFKDLMLYDKMRECKFAQADDLINGLTLVKIGGNADGEYRATQEDIEYYKNILEEGAYDKNFKLVTHAGVDITRVGASGTVLEIAEDMNLIIKNIYTGLMIPPAVVDQEGAAYNSASIGLEVLRQRYFNFRAIMARWLVNKIFAPISEIQGFYEYKDGVKKLIVPEIEWNQMNLYDLQDYIQNITGLVSSKQASLQTLYRSLGLNYQEERVKMRQEAIDEEIGRKERQILATMTISELRSLDPEKDILEPIDDKGGRAAPPEAMGGPFGGLEPMPGGMGMEPMGMPGGLPELAPPPGGELTPPPGAGAPIGGGATPALGPGAGPKGPGVPV